MPSLVYNSCLSDAVTGSIDFDGDEFAVMLVTSAYAPNKDLHTRRSDVAASEVAGTGYSAQTVDVVVQKDLTNDRVDIQLGGKQWPGSTIAARGAVYYKKRGGAPSADELIAYISFGDADVTSLNGLFSLTPSTLRLQN